MTWPVFREPTGEECQSNAKIGDGYAAWYPQMGGYVGRCVVIPNGNGGCFEVYVWHDGEFPFGSEDRSPARLHHCSPQQFIEFGQWAAGLPGMDDSDD